MFKRTANFIQAKVSSENMARLFKGVPLKWGLKIQNMRFRQTVKWAAKNSPFYKKAFAERGIDASKVRVPADLGDFYTTPDDVAANAEEFICAPPNIVFESSGTSGRNKRVYYSREELEMIGDALGCGYRLMGVTKQDRVANAFDFSIWIPGMLCHYGLMSSGNFCQAFGKVDPVEVFRRLDQYKFTVVLGEPTWLIRLTQLNEQAGCPHKLKMLVGGAEEMPAEAIPWMEKVWGGAVVKMTYASVEMANAIAFQPCNYHDAYHIDYFNFMPEIIEPDAEGYGELVYTTLLRRVMPLIRYRSRDVARIEKEPCKCGQPAPRMSKLRGRRDELVVASGGNLYPKMFENIIGKIDGLTHDWQVVFKLEGVREILEMNVETTRDKESVEKEIHASATDQYPDLMKNLALGIFEMRVVTHPPETLRVNRKLKRVVDRRYFEPAPEPAETVA